MIQATTPAGTTTQAFSWLPRQARSARFSEPPPTSARDNPPVVATAIDKRYPSGNRRAVPCRPMSRSPIIDLAVCLGGGHHPGPPPRHARDPKQVLRSAQINARSSPISRPADALRAGLTERRRVRAKGDGDGRGASYRRRTNGRGRGGPWLSRHDDARRSRSRRPDASAQPSVACSP